MSVATRTERPQFQPLFPLSSRPAYGFLNTAEPHMDIANDFLCTGDKKKKKKQHASASFFVLSGRFLVALAVRSRFRRFPGWYSHVKKPVHLTKNWVAVVLPSFRFPSLCRHTDLRLVFGGPPSPLPRKIAASRRGNCSPEARGIDCEGHHHGVAGPRRL